MTIMSVRVPSAPARRSVPGRIRVISGVTAGCLVLLFAALAAGGLTVRDGLKVIGSDAGPQVVATAELYLALSDMDAAVADVLVMGGAYERERREATARYEQRRSDANQALLEAFRLSGDKEAERQTVQSVLDGLGEYERLAGQALLLNDQSPHPPGPPPDGVVTTYQQATDLMRLVLLPQAYNLTLENGTIVRSTYDDKATTVPLLRGAVVLAGLLAVGCLVWLQVYLARRFRRMFGPALLIATLAVAISTVVGANALGQDERALREAKSAGFDSVLALARARAISNSMQGDQSRYLLDKGRADTYEHTYLDKSLSLMYVEAGNLETYHARVADGSGGFRGLLGPELVGAKGAQVEEAYKRFQAADTTFRALVADGKVGEAVAARLDPVGAAFDAYDKSLVALADEHRQVFDRAIDRGESTLGGLWLLLPIAAGVIGLLVVTGVWPRLKEYR